MTGYHLLKHSVAQVIGNLNEALQISGLPWLALMAVQVVARAALPPEAAVLVVLIANLVLGLWIAVAWHRFVLLQELPLGNWPEWQPTRIMQYLGRSMLIAISLVLASFALTIVVSLVSAGPAALVMLMAVYSLLGSYLFYRFSPVLPAAAMDHKMRLAEGWKATAPISGAVFQASILVALMVMVGQQVLALFSGFPPLTLMLAELVAGWVLVMISISLLTTVYGVAVEGRRLE